jgi:hypothetical protein
MIILIVFGSMPLVADINRYRLEEDSYLAAVKARPSALKFLQQKYTPDAQNTDSVWAPMPSATMPNEPVQPDPVQYGTTVAAWALGLCLYLFGRSVRYVLANE